MSLLPPAEEIQQLPPIKNTLELELEKAIVTLHHTRDKEGTGSLVTVQGELPEHTLGKQLLNHSPHKWVGLGPGSLAPAVDHRDKGIVRLE